VTRRYISSGDRERARCLALVMEALERGCSEPGGKEFADGYSVACQEIAVAIAGPGAGPVQMIRRVVWRDP
jgi:hypothetical protein